MIGAGARVALATSLMLLLAGAGPGQPERIDQTAGGLPRPAIILFWATWCASCRGEMRRLPEIGAAAGDIPVATIALDPPATARAAIDTFGIPLRTAYADGRKPEQVLAEWGGGIVSLPLAVALDRGGQVCARKHGLLGTDEVKAWAARCSR